MHIINKIFLVYLLLSPLISCRTSGYITDQESIQRQKEMRRYRTGVNLADVTLLVASSVSTAFTGINIYPEPQSKSFRKIKLVSESKDTLFINMVTDWLWRDSAYCDIRGIVMPPLKSAKVIVPLGAAYNIFFRNDFKAPDDEKMEVNTADISKVKLKEHTFAGD